MLFQRRQPSVESESSLSQLIKRNNSTKKIVISDNVKFKQKSKQQSTQPTPLKNLLESSSPKVAEP